MAPDHVTVVAKALFYFECNVCNDNRLASRAYLVTTVFVVVKTADSGLESNRKSVEFYSLTDVYRTHNR